jgi:hypothetical protein
MAIVVIFHDTIRSQNASHPAARLDHCSDVSIDDKPAAVAAPVTNFSLPLFRATKSDFGFAYIEAIFKTHQMMKPHTRFQESLCTSHNQVNDSANVLDLYIELRERRIGPFSNSSS